MLEKPSLQDGKISACLQDSYGLAAMRVTFLPIGADLNTAVYRVWANDEKDYFLKLRSGVFNEVSVALPRFLCDMGINQIIPPLATKAGKLWATLDAYNMILYPFVEGRNGYEVDLSDGHWVDFGKALKRIHSAKLPQALLGRIRRENYSPYGRELVKKVIGRLGADRFTDPVAVQMAAFMKSKTTEILDLVGRAERCAMALQARPP